MKLIPTVEEHFKELRSMTEGADQVLISTYGIYAGINHYGQDLNGQSSKYTAYAKEFLDSLIGVSKVNIVVGLYPYSSCKGTARCVYCESRYVRGLLRLSSHKDHFSSFKWRVKPNNHLKCVLAIRGNSFEGIVGGRNLSDSNWNDLTFRLEPEDAKEVFKMVVPIWKEAEDLTDDTLSSLLDRYEISKHSMELV
jgi:hypothetical protein